MENDTTKTPSPAPEQPARPATVTQAELNEIREANIHMNRLAAAVKAKLNAGATVEPGPLTALTDGSAVDDPDPGSLAIDGVDIGPREEIEPHGAELVQVPAAQTITQAELRSIVNLYQSAERIAARLYRRIEAGATVEPGPIKVSTTGTYGPDAPFIGAELGGLDLDWEETMPEEPAE